MNISTIAEKVNRDLSTLDLNLLSARTVKLTTVLLTDSREQESKRDRKVAAKVSQLIECPTAKQFTVSLVDEVLRIESHRESARHLRSLLRRNELPTSFSFRDRCLLKFGAFAARYVPSVVMPLIRKRIKQDSSHVIISAEPSEFKAYLAEKNQENWRVNVNLLGEAVLGQNEADRRWGDYLDALKKPEIKYISVKLSAIYSHISLTGYERTVENLKARLRALYRVAMSEPTKSGKFVNLDMEEYRDLHLTVDVFRSVLEEPEFLKLSAGIVLQAYLPDSYSVQQELTNWACDRVQRGGAPIKIRIVKGANLAMERVEASLQGWQQAPYQSKLESDANYKRMLCYAINPEFAHAVRIGVASHNLFDISFAVLLTEDRCCSDQVEFEMLEGMANAQTREVHQLTGDLLVYAPICRDEDFESAVSYLVRRFDENTQPGSFLSSLFNLEVGSEDWNDQVLSFEQACQLINAPRLSQSPNRIQCRLTDRYVMSSAEQAFRNVTNTDFALPRNRTWLNEVVNDRLRFVIEDVPIQVSGITATTDIRAESRDPSRYENILYKYSQGRLEHVDLALKTASEALVSWENLGIEKRAEILRKFAEICSNERGETLGLMMADAGKSALEADVEISEAIDFAEYYSR
ncbi:bifunctional proline dehydrogenase/L-glutamate gamma-semialdehyde dehydrogenase, partial [uncultured Rubinisphaera sp.]|uniref:bifunctional proline dehydrogenase/L-glutamate gamma-semialdehyde dehydrogenase n=1 Tax=uncultured Rubinisphaera sp. TaxID=1678686 RepID=UPI0030DA194B